MRVRRPALVFVLLAFAWSSPAALGASRISGRLSNAGYRVVLVGADGRAKAVKPKSNRRFSLRVRTTRGATLHLLKGGRYFGPVVLRGKVPRVALAAARSVALGTVRVRRGYAITSRRVAGYGPAIHTRNGIPSGAGRLGLVRIRSARSAQTDDTATPGDDTDLDGLPNAFDADDDGDLKLDNVDAAQPAGPALELSSALPLDITDAINTNAGVDANRDETLRQQLRLLFIVHRDQVGDAQRVGVTCPFDWCADAQVVTGAGTGASDTAWADGDGDGLRDLVPDGPVFTRQIYPRTTEAGLHPGDTFTATSDTGVSAVAALTMYFTSSLAVKSLGDTTITYPADENSPGAPGHPIKIPPKVRITLWRPQRAAIPGAETGGVRDIGGLRYGAGVGSGNCLPADFSDMSDTLKLAAGDSEAPLQDTAADAAPSGETISFTIDAKACSEHNNGPSSGGGFPLLTIVAKDAAGDLSRQLIVVQFG